MNEKIRKAKEKATKVWRDHKIEIISYSAYFTLCFFTGVAMGKWAFGKGAEYGEQNAIDRMNAMLDEGIINWNETLAKNIEDGKDVDLTFAKDGIMVTISEEFEIDGQ